jgi:hypothetical protein
VRTHLNREFISIKFPLCLSPLFLLTSFFIDDLHFPYTEPLGLELLITRASDQMDILNGNVLNSVDNNLGHNDGFSTLRRTEA